MALVMDRHGAELDDDPAYRQLLAEGRVQAPPPAEAMPGIRPYAKRALAVYGLAVAAIVIFGLFDNLRPEVAGEDGLEPLGMTAIIQLVMLTGAALMLVFAAVKPGQIVAAPIFTAGMVAMIAIFGIAWMADTFIANNEDAIVGALGELAQRLPWLMAVAIFLVAALTTSQAAATRTMVPIGLALGIGPQYMIAMWQSVVGVLFLPANGTQLAAAAQDRTGTTTIGTKVVDHSFQRPLLVCWVTTTIFGLVISWLLF